MRIGSLNGFSFVIPAGKVGRGRNKRRTNVVQVRKHGCVFRRFRFVIGDRAGRNLAIRKAWVYASEHASLAILLKGWCRSSSR